MNTRKWFPVWSKLQQTEDIHNGLLYLVNEINSNGSLRINISKLRDKGGC